MATADMLRERKMRSVAIQATPRRERGMACSGLKGVARLSTGIVPGALRLVDHIDDPDLHQAPVRPRPVNAVANRQAQ